ncbi:hypothetical protein [Halopseudomonas pelagia]|uniref:Uncharacterized protein n=1 Tax=Halopseudomonas pelagia TaxID=553151 RepID=A0AA91U4C9_9GAMM|nr:hypothetical protein [Halopseudomonas pelagia]PCD00491.1 hypothetical protein CO192_04695 [Halopseudomonas pelagia]QFY55194.1 hypothetical protein EAO82_01660 [Halopseudomonas pelagia]
MPLFLNKQKLDISTPSNFSLSLKNNSDLLDKIFKPEIWEEISKKPDARAYMEEIEAFAKSGNSQCQELVAQWNIILCQGKDDPSVLKFGLRKAIEYGAMAAKSGVASEALNLPISLGQLGQILIEESGGKFTGEIEHIFKEMYRWSLRNSENAALPEWKRAQARETARELYEGMPELYE